jgi:pimeloyl-ACP methyl ester carboxylesterase
MPVSRGEEIKELADTTQPLKTAILIYVYSSFNFAEKTVKVSDYKLNIITAGPDTDITFILVHGIGVSHRYFSQLIRVLSEKYRVIAVDLPGFGKSPDPDHTLDIPQVADLIHDLLQQQGIKRSVLVGHSMGCQFVTEVVRRHPEDDIRLVLMGPTVNPAERKGLVQAWRLTQDTTREPWELNKIVLLEYLKCGIPRYLRTLQYMLADKIEDRLQLCDVPTLVVRGERDPIVPREWAQQITDLLPNAKLIEIPRTPHIVQYNTENLMPHLEKLASKSA